MGRFLDALRGALAKWPRRYSVPEDYPQVPPIWSHRKKFEEQLPPDMRADVEEMERWPPKEEP